MGGDFSAIISQYMLYLQGPQEKFCKADQDCFEAPVTDWDFSQNWGFDLKDSKYMLYNVIIPGYNVNVSDDQQPEFRNLSEFYIIIFLNKLKIVENTEKKRREKKK